MTSNDTSIFDAFCQHILNRDLAIPYNDATKRYPEAVMQCVDLLQSNNFDFELTKQPSFKQIAIRALAHETSKFSFWVSFAEKVQPTIKDYDYWRTDIRRL